MLSLHLLTQSIAVVAVAAVIGGILLFASVVAPTVFAALDATAGQRYLRRIFPRYYVFLAAAAGIAALCTITVHPRLGMLMALIAAAALATRQLLLPRINAARDAELAGEVAAGDRFRLLHRSSVAVNLLQLAAAGVVLLRLVF